MIFHSRTAAWITCDMPGCASEINGQDAVKEAMLAAFDAGWIVRSGMWICPVCRLGPSMVSLIDKVPHD